MKHIDVQEAAGPCGLLPTANIGNSNAQPTQATDAQPAASAPVAAPSARDRYLLAAVRQRLSGSRPAAAPAAPSGCPDETRS